MPKPAPRRVAVDENLISPEAAGAACQQAYREVCAKEKIRLNSSIYERLRELVLDIPIDTMVPLELHVLFNFMAAATRLKTIRIQGAAAKEAPRTAFSSTSTRKSAMASTTSKKMVKPKKQQQADLPNSQDKSSVVKLCKALTSRIANNSFLEELSLSRVLLSGDNMAHLCRALKHNFSIRHLKLTDCRLRESCISSLLDHLMENYHLTDLTLTRLRLSDSFTPSLIKYLQHHSLQRDMHTWELGLRGESGLDSKLPGIQNLDLSRNSFGDSFAQSLAHLVESDTWLRAIDVSSNKVSQEGVKLMVEALASNQSLLYFDLSRNPGVESSYLLRCQQYIVRNMISFSKQTRTPYPVVRDRYFNGRGLDVDDSSQEPPTPRPSALKSTLITTKTVKTEQSKEVPIQLVQRTSRSLLHRSLSLGDMSTISSEVYVKNSKEPEESEQENEMLLEDLSCFSETDMDIFDDVSGTANSRFELFSSEALREFISVKKKEFQAESNVIQLSIENRQLKQLLNHFAIQANEHQTQEGSKHNANNPEYISIDSTRESVFTRAPPSPLNIAGARPLHQDNGVGSVLFNVEKMLAKMTTFVESIERNGHTKARSASKESSRDSGSGEGAFGLDEQSSMRTIRMVADCLQNMF
eukprot:GILK01012332.1.p1 GENE.GILK01012332.1~~GILK01012332.1.p1  ORF type:complete len:640 (+),score=98.93 GILK01012332.1:89-2008(+)